MSRRLDAAARLRAAMVTRHGAELDADRHLDRMRRAELRAGRLLVGTPWWDAWTVAEDELRIAAIRCEHLLAARRGELGRRSV